MRRPRRGALQILELVLDDLELLLLRLVPAHHLVLPLPQQRQRLLDLDELRLVDRRGLRAAALLVHVGERIAQLLALAAEQVDLVLILLERQLRLLVEGCESERRERCERVSGERVCRRQRGRERPEKKWVCEGGAAAHLCDRPGAGRSATGGRRAPLACPFLCDAFSSQEFATAGGADLWWYGG